VRKAAAEALEGTADPAALAALVRLCQDTESGVREAAAEALEGTTDPTTLAALVGLCEHPERKVRRTVANALESARPRSAVAQQLLAKRRSEEHRSEIQGLLFARLLSDDVPFSEWPEG
jgi:HEAT repeat protein